MSFLQPLMLIALPLIALPIIIHLINQWRYQTRPWGAMMFLLAANRMNRGFARIRQWLILAMRTLAILGLILAVARPLASGLLGWTGGGETDTTIVLLDRSPSMQLNSRSGVSKLQTGRRQLADALSMLGSQHWVTVDSVTGQAESFESLDAMMNSSAFTDASATSDLPTMMQSALEYMQTNKPGPTEIWICSDLRRSDWSDESGTWSVVREGFEQLPQSVRINLLAYPEASKDNLTIRVTDVRRAATADVPGGGNDLLISLRISRQSDAADAATMNIPVEVEIEGARTTLDVEMNGNQADVRNYRIALPGNKVRGWGSVSIPADANLSDNQFYFVFDDPPPRRVVIVSEDRGATRALEVAASIMQDGSDNSAVEVIEPSDVDSLVLDDAALLLWQTSLPDAATAPAVNNYIDQGGQVIFFPPSRLISQGSLAGATRFMEVGWDRWMEDGEKVMVENWRGDQDLLAATDSGAGLPVGQLKLSGYATLQAEVEISSLATLTGGNPLLAKIPTSKGGAYFCTVSASPDASTMAENGVVLFVLVQRAIQQGQLALGNTTQRTATAPEADQTDWRQVAGATEALSTEFAAQAGIYADEEKLFAVNRAESEDRQDVLPDQRIESLFEGLPFSRVDDSAGSLTGIVREVWRIFLIVMILALLLEAALCLPRRTVAAAPNPT